MRASLCSTYTSCDDCTAVAGICHRPAQKAALCGRACTEYFVRVVDNSTRTQRTRPLVASKAAGSAGPNLELRNMKREYWCWDALARILFTRPSKVVYLRTNFPFWRPNNQGHRQCLMPALWGGRTVAIDVHLCYVRVLRKSVTVASRRLCF